jgi:hypothetical protein
MYKEHLTTEQGTFSLLRLPLTSIALAKLRKARPCVCPNQGFRRQLDLWGEMQYSLDGKTKAHRLYNLQKMAIEYETTRRIPTTIYVADDPQSDSEEVFACGSCRRKLFTSANIVEHNNGKI